MTSVFTWLALNWLQVLLGWLGAGWLVCGLAIWQRKAGNSVNRTMTFCLFIWPAVVGAIIVALLSKAALFVFDPDAGPLALGWQLIRHTASTPVPPAQQPVAPAEVKP